MELFCYDFDIVYRLGPENISPDTFSRSHCGMIGNDQQSLIALHEALCNPIITRMYHFVKSKNMPYSVEDVEYVQSASQGFIGQKPLIS